MSKYEFDAIEIMRAQALQFDFAVWQDGVDGPWLIDGQHEFGNTTYCRYLTLDTQKAALECAIALGKVAARRNREGMM